jgi:hypothetical protein
MALAWKNRTQQPRRLNKVLCMSVQQASRSKVAVMPFELEKAKEPPLHLYKPKEPYTATIVSVERLVGPRAPGETCHVVIDHGGNVPYWEGQSYGVIPPVSISCLVLPSVMIMNLYFFVLSSLASLHWTLHSLQFVCFLLLYDPLLITSALNKIVLFRYIYAIDIMVKSHQKFVCIQQCIQYFQFCEC